ncbi:MAG TPA: hypothetical protein VMW48_15445 [Vicinamibacterales bacterium]|nr:hypothetical protein [Vicinamibacterales bacterium]
MSAEQSNGRCAQGVEHTTRIKDLERRMNTVEEAVFEIRDRLLGRPSWFVSLVITALVTACVGMGIYILKGRPASAPAASAPATTSTVTGVIIP